MGAHEDELRAEVDDFLKDKPLLAQLAGAALENEGYGRRKPDAVTVRLGHWEQMQLALAIAFVREVLPTLPDEVVKPGPNGRWENLDADYFKRIEWLFQNGMTSITHEEVR
jgi:hypothetical protein